MRKHIPTIFIDSSVIIAALLFSKGSSALLLTLCEGKIFSGFISENIVSEIKEVCHKKFPAMWHDAKKLFSSARLKKVVSASKADLAKARKWISDANDAHVLAGGKKARTDYLITLDVRDFIRDTNVSRKSGITIYTPAQFLDEVL